LQPERVIFCEKIADFPSSIAVIFPWPGYFFLCCIDTPKVENNEGAKGLPCSGEMLRYHFSFGLFSLAATPLVVRVILG